MKKSGGYLNPDRFNTSIILDNTYFNDDLTLKNINDINIGDFNNLILSYAQYLNPYKYIKDGRIIDDSNVIVSGDNNINHNIINKINDSQNIVQYTANINDSFIPDIKNPFEYYKNHLYYNDFIKFNLEAHFLEKFNKKNVFINSESILNKHYSLYFNSLHRPTILFNPFLIMLNSNLLWEYQHICNDKDIRNLCDKWKSETVKDRNIKNVEKGIYITLKNKILDKIGKFQDRIINSMSSYYFNIYSNKMIYEIKKNNFKQEINNILTDFIDKISVIDGNINNIKTYSDLKKFKKELINKSAPNIHIYIIEEIEIKLNIDTNINIFNLWDKTFNNILYLIHSINIDDIPIENCIFNSGKLIIDNVLAEYLSNLINIPKEIIKKDFINTTIETNIDFAQLENNLRIINEEINVSGNDYMSIFIYKLVLLIKSKMKIDNLYPIFNYSHLIDHMYINAIMKDKCLSISNYRVLDTYFNIVEKKIISPDLYNNLNELILANTEEFVPICYKHINGAPDCFESGIRNFINSFIYSNNIFDWKILPESTLECVKEFYKKNNTFDDQNSVNKGHNEWFLLLKENIIEKLKLKVKNDIGIVDSIMGVSSSGKERGDLRTSYYYFAIILGIIFGINYDSVKPDEQSCILFLRNIFEINLFKKFKINISCKKTENELPQFSHVFKLEYDNNEMTLKIGHCQFEKKSSLKLLAFNEYNEILVKNDIEFSFINYFYNRPTKINNKELSNNECNILLYISNSKNFELKIFNTSAFKNNFIKMVDTNNYDAIKHIIFYPRNFTKFLTFLFSYYNNKENIIENFKNVTNKPKDSNENKEQFKIAKSEKNISERVDKFLKIFATIFFIDTTNNDALHVGDINRFSFKLFYILIYYLKMNPSEHILPFIKLDNFTKLICNRQDEKNITEYIFGNSFNLIKDLFLEKNNTFLRYVLYLYNGRNKYKYVANNNILADILQKGKFDNIINLAIGRPHDNIKRLMPFILINECAKNNNIEDKVDIFFENYDFKTIIRSFDDFISMYYHYKVKLNYKNSPQDTLYIKYYGNSIISHIKNMNMALMIKRNIFIDTDNVDISIINDEFINVSNNRILLTVDLNNETNIAMIMKKNYLMLNNEAYYYFEKYYTVMVDYFVILTAKLKNHEIVFLFTLQYFNNIKKSFNNTIFKGYLFNNVPEQEILDDNLMNRYYNVFLTIISKMEDDKILLIHEDNIENIYNNFDNNVHDINKVSILVNKYFVDNKEKMLPAEYEKFKKFLIINN